MSISTRIADDAIQLCTFAIGGRTYAVDVLSVREVNPDIAMTRVPHTAPSVRGLVNVRGEVFLILDLQQALRGTVAEIGRSSRLVLFKERIGPAFGVLVDAVGDITTITPEEMLEVESDDDDVRHHGGGLRAVGVVKRPGELVIILDATQITALARPSRKTKMAAL